MFQYVYQGGRMKQSNGKSLCRFLSVFFLLIFTHNIARAITIEVADSPDTNLSLALTAINSAEETIVMNAYELNSKEIAAALIKQIKNSVLVTILEEGQPVGGIGDEGIAIREKVVAAMNRSSLPHKFLVMSAETPRGLRQRRFHFNHAKYIIIDGQALLVGSENYTTSGHPVVGTKGTRGWETLIHDKGMASSFQQLFKSDSSIAFGDVFLASESRFRGPIPFVGQWNLDFSEMASLEGFLSPSRLPKPKTFDVTTINQLTSPNTSLTGLLNFIKGAKTSLDLELMSFSYRWGNTGNVSPLFQAIVDAARRGVEVRVLLNDETVFGNHRGLQEEIAKKTNNVLTAEQLEAIGKKEGLAMEAGIADVEAMGVKYIHNKGGLADGKKVLISSINWNRNSLENNRETAVVVHSEEVHDYYSALFETDWNASRTKKH